MKNMESSVSKIQISYFNGEEWNRHKARKRRICLQYVDDLIKTYCAKEIKPGEYYWLYRDQKDTYCQECKEKKERKNQERKEKRMKEHQERMEEIRRTEFTPEKITERLFADCEEYKVDPMNIIRLMQNRMDLS